MEVQKKAFVSSTQLSVSTEVVLASHLSVAKKVILSSDLSVSKGTILSSTLSVAKSVVLSSDLSVSGGVVLSSTISTSGIGIFDSAQIGQWGGMGNTYAVLVIKIFQEVINNYSLKQDNNGQTYINAPSGQSILFRNNNGTKALLNSVLVLELQQKLHKHWVLVMI